jgi:electron transport complex protein RnfD
MNGEKKLVVSHAPFWHDGRSIAARNYNTMLAALPAALMGLWIFGGHALGVLSLCIGTAMAWELVLNKIMRRPPSIGNGSAALTGMLLGMILPASAPFWMVIVATFVAVVLGMVIYGGLGGNPFSPVILALAVLGVSWPLMFNYNYMLQAYDTGFAMAYPLAQLKAFGPGAVTHFSVADLLMGKQSGGIGATFGLGLIAGGLYLIVRGFIRWEISFSFLVGVLVTAWLFNASDSSAYAGPAIHLLSGYTLIGAFFLATEDSSSPVNFIPMLIYGAGAGILTVLIRNIGVYVDGVVLAILLMNVANPLIDAIRPKALGKVVRNA